MTPVGQYQDGSRKKKIYDCFVQHGPDTAWTLGHKIKLKPNTLRSWFSTWKSVAPVNGKGVKPKAKVVKATKTKPKSKSKGADAAVPTAA